MKTFKSFIKEEQLDEKNNPTSPEKWARAKSAAKSKFAVYPSAYANAWAAKKYKSMGGGWRSTKEEVELDEKKNVMDYEEPHLIVNKLNTIIHNAKELLDILDDDVEMPEWIESKITLSEDYITTCVNYMRSEMNEEVLDEKSAAWQRKEGKNPEGGLNRKGIASYRRENPGSKLSMAVTTPPSKLKKGSKAAKRRKSFCARMGGMPGPMKDEKGRPTRKALSLRKWNC